MMFDLWRSNVTYRLYAAIKKGRGDMMPRIERRVAGR
jgi:hypothetical protein